MTDVNFVAMATPAPDLSPQVLLTASRLPRQQIGLHSIDKVDAEFA